MTIYMDQDLTGSRFLYLSLLNTIYSDFALLLKNGNWNWVIHVLLHIYTDFTQIFTVTTLITAVVVTWIVLVFFFSKFPIHEFPKDALLD